MAVKILFMILFLGKAATPYSSYNHEHASQVSTLDIIILWTNVEKGVSLYVWEL